jgi:ACS family hexuronate transporter-like MFS transporter
LPYLGADLGALAGGWLAAWLIQVGLGPSLGRKLVLVPSALLASLGALACLVGSPYAAIGLLTVALFGHLSWATNVHTAISEISPRRHVAVMYGITGAAGTLAGALTQPLIGYVVDVSGYTPAFACAGAAYLLAIVMLLAAGRIEPMPGPAANE